MQNIIAGVIFLRKNKKQNRKNDDLDKTQEIIDLRRFISSKDSFFDPQGSYTGVPNEVFYDNAVEEPIQDADDL